MFITLIFLTIVADQLIKYFIRLNFYQGESLAIIENIFHLTFVKNTGAAFGILENKLGFFIIFSVIIIIIMLIYRHLYYPKNYYFNISFSLIIGGAIGNLIDRIYLNYVVDYLDFRIWPVFNLADSAVVIGATLLVIHLIFLENNVGN